MNTVDELVVDELVKVAWFKDRQTIALLVRAGFKCDYCGQELILSFTDCTHAEKDHIVPTSKGGAKHDDSNLVASCLTCNALKGNYMPAGNSREERIADVRHYVNGARAAQIALWQKYRDILKR